MDVKILLVDDRRENLLALESILGSLGHELVTAASGEEALRAVLREDFAVILLDVRMPGMDGFEVAAHIRLRERSRDTPIIFLTAAGDGPHQTLRGYAAGAADYLAKPFDPWVLRAKVGVFAELHRKNRQLREQAELLRSQAGVTPRCSTSCPAGWRRSRGRWRCSSTRADGRGPSGGWSGGWCTCGPRWMRCASPETDFQAVRALPEPSYALQNQTPPAIATAARIRLRPKGSRRNIAPSAAPNTTEVSRNAETAASAPRVCAHSTSP